MPNGLSPEEMGISPEEMKTPEHREPKFEFVQNLVIGYLNPELAAGRETEDQQAKINITKDVMAEMSNRGIELPDDLNEIDEETRNQIIEIITARVESGWKPEITTKEIESIETSAVEALGFALENYTPDELRESPLTAEDVLMILVSSGAEFPESWAECSSEEQDAIRKAMIESAKSLPGSKVVDTENGPVITAE